MAENTQQTTLTPAQRQALNEAVEGYALIFTSGTDEGYVHRTLWYYLEGHCDDYESETFFMDRVKARLVTSPHFTEDDLRSGKYDADISMATRLFPAIAERTPTENRFGHRGPVGLPPVQQAHPYLPFPIISVTMNGRPVQLAEMMGPVHAISHHFPVQQMPSPIAPTVDPIAPAKATNSPLAQQPSPFLGFVQMWTPTQTLPAVHPATPTPVNSQPVAVTEPVATEPSQPSPATTAEPEPRSLENDIMVGVIARSILRLDRPGREQLIKMLVEMGNPNQPSQK